MERTLLILKPDAVQRHLIGQIISRFEQRGLQIVGMKFMRITPAIAEVHYEAHKAKPFYPGLVRFMTSSPVVVFAVEGKDAITVARKMMGATKAALAEPGTVRGDYGMSSSFNLIHGSDSTEAATKELSLFFKPEELLDWTPDSQVWSYDMTKGQPE
jgi:nucleoside-diphosphate kinase